MPIPTYDQLLRPLLENAANADITRRSATEAMISGFKLSSEEAERRLPSGGATYIRNRVGWAMSFLTKGGLIAKVAPKTYRATEAGKEFLSNHPQTILVSDLEAIPGWEEALKQVVLGVTSSDGLWRIAKGSSSRDPEGR